MFHWSQLLRSAIRSRVYAEEKRASRQWQEREEVAAFCSRVVAPALEDLKQELERLGRRVSVYRCERMFHITVWYDQVMEFQYSIAACRRKRRFRRYGYVHPAATTYQVEAKRVYTLSDIRRTDQHRFAKQVAAQYRQSLLAR